MKSDYEHRNVELSSLSDWIKRFFERKGFKALKEEEDDAFRIRVRPTHLHEVIGKIIVTIRGTPDKFTLKFEAGARSDSLIKFGRLTTLFGGGIAYLRGIKSQEAEEKLERQFWKYIEEKIDMLHGSAKLQE